MKKKITKIEIALSNHGDTGNWADLFNGEKNYVAYNYGFPIGITPLTCMIDGEIVTYSQIVAESISSPFRITKVSHKNGNYKPVFTFTIGQQLR